jgi:hypothetical protein
LNQPDYPERCETCSRFTWAGSGDGGTCRLLARDQFPGTPVQPHMSCPHYKADVGPLLAEIGTHRRAAAAREMACEMTGDGMGV